MTNISDPLGDLTKLYAKLPEVKEKGNIAETSAQAKKIYAAAQAAFANQPEKLEAAQAKMNAITAELSSIEEHIGTLTPSAVKEILEWVNPATRLNAGLAIRGAHNKYVSKRLFETQGKVPFTGTVDEMFALADKYQSEGTLSKLNLANNQNIDDAALARIAARMPNLTHLNLSNTKVTQAGLASLNNLPLLHELNLSGNQFGAGVVKMLTPNQKLRTLILSNTQITNADLADLKELKITHLDISDCPRVTEAGLKHLKVVRGVTEGVLPSLDKTHGLLSLNLTGIHISTDLLDELKELKDLERLEVSLSTDTKDADLAKLKGLKALVSLDLSHNTKITDAGLAHLAHLPQLQSLDLTSTQITDAGLAHLANLTQLQTLDLFGIQITGTGLAYLVNLNNLQSLNLNHTQITDAGLSHLINLTYIHTLGLKNTQITDAGLAHLSKLIQLQWLDLSSTDISDLGLAHLANLTNLRSLNLYYTKITSYGLSHLANLTQLQALDLRRTNVYDPGLAYLANLTLLQKIDVKDTGISDAGLKKHLARLTNLKVTR